MAKLSLIKYDGKDIVLDNINDLDTIIITLENGKQLELSVVSNSKGNSLFINGYEETQYNIKPFIQGGILIKPE